MGLLFCGWYIVLLLLHGVLSVKGIPTVAVIPATVSIHTFVIVCCYWRPFFC
jgi:hypothetical protein